jgi:hypothetical protein
MPDHLLLQDWLGLGDISLHALWALFFAFSCTTIQASTAIQILRLADQGIIPLQPECAPKGIKFASVYR